MPASDLQRLTGHLSRALTEAEVAAVVIGEGTATVGASSAGLWRLTDGALELVRALGYPDAALAMVQHLPVASNTPVTDAARLGEAVWLSSRQDYETRYPASAARTSGMTAPERYATACLPLVLDGRVIGALALTFADDRVFEDRERAFLELLAWHCAQGFERARLITAERDARRRAEDASERATFLSRASALLGSSLDYEETLRNVAKLAVPRLADWCGIELVDAEVGSRQVAVAHVDPAKVEFARELRRRYPPDRSASNGVHQVIRTGVAQLYAEIPDEVLVRGSRDAEHLRISRELGLRSALIAPIRDRDGVVGAITFVLASAERRYGADDLQMAEQLGERAGAAIANARLYEQTRLAVTVRDEFLSIAGHELRTPVAAISLLVQSLQRMRDDAPPAKLKERITKLASQSDRLIGLVEDLLDVTKITSGQIELEREEVDLGVVVRHTAIRMRDAFERAGTPLDLALAAVPGLWDRARIDQITTNLLSNALKYGKGRPVRVEVALDGDVAVLAVTDHGIGIPIADQARIFERFERAVSSRNFGGFGIGLWIVRQLIEAHGGTIAVVSVPGQGAAFSVRIPVRPRQER